jgi:hypothetical protein
MHVKKQALKHSSKACFVSCLSLCPAGEPLHVDLFELGQFLVLTMADFAEQLFSWQDCMFGNSDGALRLEGAPNPEPRYVW